MRRFKIFMLSLVGLFALSCAESQQDELIKDPEAKKLPTISISKVEAGVTSLTFKVELSDATEAGYIIVKGDEVSDDSFEAVKVYANATKLDKAENQEVVVSELDAETEYLIMAYALNGEMESIADIALSAELTISTLDPSAGPVPTVNIAAEGSTTSSISFKLTPQNNPYECCYKVYRKTPDFKEKDSSDVMDNGNFVTTNEMESVITVGELIDDQTYIVYAVAIAADYKYELSRLEIKTLALDPPTTNIEKQQFMVDTLIVSTIRMYNVKLINENYKLDMLIQSDYYFEPLIPVGNYILEQGTAPGEPGYIRDSDISLYDIKAKQEVPIHKGALELTLSNGVYSFEGHFITEANELFEYEASSEIAYPLNYRGCSALLYPETNILEQENGNDYFRLEMHLADGVAIESGVYSIANGKLLSDSRIAVRFGGKDTGEIIELEQLEVEFSLRDSDNDNEYKYSGTATTTEGYKIEIVGEPYVDVTDAPKPEFDTLEIKSVEMLSWYFGDYPSGWYSTRYSVDCEVDGYLAFCFELDAGLFADADDMIADGFYGYNEEAGPMLEVFFKKDGGSVQYFQDKGGVTLKKLDNGEYEMTVELYEMGEERAFTAKFTGKISLEYWVG